MKINNDIYINQMQLKQKNLTDSESRFKELLAKKTDKVINKPKANENIREDQELRKVSQEFEAIFINMMFKQMRSSISKSGLIDGGMGEEIFEDMYYDKLSKTAAEKNELGLAEMIYQQLSNKS